MNNYRRKSSSKIKLTIIEHMDLSQENDLLKLQANLSRSMSCTITVSTNLTKFTIQRTLNSLVISSKEGNNMLDDLIITVEDTTPKRHITGWKA